MMKNENCIWCHADLPTTEPRTTIMTTEGETIYACNHKCFSLHARHIPTYITPKQRLRICANCDGKIPVTEQDGQTVIRKYCSDKCKEIKAESISKILKKKYPDEEVGKVFQLRPKVNLTDNKKFCYTCHEEVKDPKVTSEDIDEPGVKLNFCNSNCFKEHLTMLMKKESPENKCRNCNSTLKKKIYFDFYCSKKCGNEMFKKMIK